MQGVGEHLLARAGLAEDQRVHAASGDIAQERSGVLGGGVEDAQRLGRAALGGEAGGARRAHHDEGEAADVEALAGGQGDRLAAVVDHTESGGPKRKIA
jgi:hypothetical protein